MRSFKKRIVFALLALTSASLLLAGCATTESEAFDATTVSCMDVASQSEVVTAEVASAKEAIDASKGTPAETDANDKLASAEAKVAALTTRAQSPECVQQTPPEGITLQQCRTNAVIAYMKEQGFTDGQYVVGEERIDTSKPEFSRQGSLGFRGDGVIPDTRAKLQENFNSDKPNEKVALEAHVRQLSQFDPAVIKNAQNWEIVQTTVDAMVSGNTGLNAGQQVAVGDTNSAAGDAAWLFIDPQTCTVPRTTVDAAGAPVDPSTPLADQPVAAHRPGCINPTGGFKPKPVPPPATCTEDCSPPPPPCNPDVEKCWETSVEASDGVTWQPNDEYEERPSLPESPAPVIPSGEIPSSNSGASGATTPDPNRDKPAAGTGTKSDGTSGGVNPDTGGGTNNGTNTGDSGNPFE